MQIEWNKFLITHSRITRSEIERQGKFYARLGARWLGGAGGKFYARSTATLSETA